MGDVRGKGLMAAVEIVSDREKKTPADPETMSGILEKAYAEGVMIRVAGPNIILSPPLVISARDVEKIVQALGVAISST